MSKTVLFYRDYRGFTGGHLKMWDYFTHVAAASGFVPKVYFTPGSVMDAENPWVAGRVTPEKEWRPESADILFLGGMDWEAVPEDCGVSVINLVQGLRHGDPSDSRFRFLSRRAWRICVSPEVEAAISKKANGVCVTIPNGLNLPALPQLERPLRYEVIIGALKQPKLGNEICAALKKQGVSALLLPTRLPRDEYFDLIRDARIVVLLPERREGFYLPALEAMALGRIVVCPDCGGNGIYRRRDNGFWPPYEVTEIVEATLSALALSEEQRRAMCTIALDTTLGHSLVSERASFLCVLMSVANSPRSDAAESSVGCRARR